MLNIDSSTRDLFLQNESIHKTIYIIVTQPDFGIHFGGSSLRYVFSNEDIVSESLEIEQNLCDGEADFVGCVASKCTFSLYEHVTESEELAPWRDFWLHENSNYKVEIQIEPDGGNTFTIWTGYVTGVEGNFLNGEIKYTCYDIFGTEEFKDWDFGSTLNWKLDEGDMSISSILRYMERRFEDLHFANPDRLSNDFLIKKQDCFNNMQALDLLKYICQMNGLFGVVRYDGQIEFRQINNEQTLTTGTFPGNETNPGDETFPGLGSSPLSGGTHILLPYSSFESSDRMMFEEPPIDGVIVMETESTDAKAKEKDNRKDVKNYEAANHVIKILGNPFVHDRSSAEKMLVCGTVEGNAGGYSYNNYTVTTNGFPFIEVGDYVDFIVTNWLPAEIAKHVRHSCLVTHRTLKGIQHMTDTYSATTIEKYDWLKESPVYLCALSGASSVEDDIEKQDEAEKDQEFKDDIEQDVDDKIDEKLEEVSNVWNVLSVDNAPSQIQPKTIYFIRGVVEMHSYSETTDGD